MSTARKLPDNVSSLLGKYEVRAQRYCLRETNLPIELMLEGSKYQIVNISESGCCFETDKDLEDGSIYQDVSISFNESDSIYKGRAEIVWKVESGSKFKYGLALASEHLDEGILRALEEIFSLKTEINNNLDGYLGLPDDFLSLVYELRTYLTNVKENVDELEERIHSAANSVKKSYLKAAEMVLGNDVVPKIRDYSIRLHAIDKKLTDENQRTLAKEVFRRELHDFFKSGSFINRAWQKPRGYAGDYVMMNQIYENTFEGQTLFAKLIHKWGVNETSSLSVRYRKDYLIDKIKHAKSITGPVIVGSVACGPAREICDFLEQIQPEKSSNYTFVLMDQDKEALLSAKRRLNNIKFKRGVISEIILLPISVKSILEGSAVANELKGIKFNLLYTAGLYDYLTQPVAKFLTKELYSWVDIKGELIVGNFHPDNPTHTISEYAADWSLIHRNEDDMYDLVDGLKYSSKKVQVDEVGIDLFLEVNR